MTHYRTTAPGPTGRGHQLAAGLLAAVIVAATLATAPFARVPLTPNPSFLPAFGALALMTELLTAALLLVKALSTGERAPLRLAATYLFATLVLGAAVVGLPRRVPADAGDRRRDTAAWLWVIWHGGLAVGVGWFTFSRPTPLRRWDAAGAAIAATLLVSALVALATAGPGWLPTLQRDGHYARINTLGIGPAVLAMVAGTGVLVLARLRLRSPLAVWLAVSMLASVMDVTLTLFGGGRFTIGWHVSRGLNLLTGLTMLAALLADLVAQARRADELNAQLERMVHTDTLTGLKNRRAFELVIDTEWRRCRREQTPLSLLMIDIDLFKQFNDRHGHPAGDGCLRQVATAIAAELQRPADLAARIGGEEFVLLLPATGQAGASLVAERVRAAVARLAIVHRDSLLGGVTVSIGAATRMPSDRITDPDTLVDAADQALYCAKNSGRNCVCCECQPLRELPAAIAVSGRR